MDKRVYSGTVWERQVAYCRALRTGNHVFVSGTTAVDASGSVIGIGDAGAQTRFIFTKIETALKECGSSLRDVVRTRMFITDIHQFDAVGSAHHDAFQGIDPVATCVEVSALVTPELLIEIEVDAIIR
jgi:enamine deaminase RidA (YjgF/YER057c/UK114 family)